MLSPSYVFGINSSPQGNLGFVDEQRLCYSVGTQLVLYNLETKNQTFIAAVDPGYEITCITFGNRSNVAMVARNKTIQKYQVYVVDVLNPRRRKVIELSEEITKKCVNAVFSGDSKCLFLLFDEPEWNLYVLSPWKSKILLKTKFSPTKRISSLAVNQFDNDTYTFSILTNKMVKTMSFSDNSIKQLQQIRYDKGFTCHVWTAAGTILCGTEDGSIVTIVNSNVVSEIHYESIDPQSTSVPRPFITGIVPTSSGFILGTSEGGCFHFERSIEGEIMKKVKELTVLDSAPIQCMALNPSEYQLAFSNRNGQLYSAKLETDPSGNDIKVKPYHLIESFHYGPVTNVVAPSRKCIVATSGADNTLRIWNTIDRVADVRKNFEMPFHCMDIHPSGLYMIYAIADALYFAHILIDDVQPQWRELVPGCRDVFFIFYMQCSFSFGGQYFAVSAENNINVYSTWTTKLLYVLKGHDARVKSLSWCANDKRIYSCGLDGKVIVWNVLSGNAEHVFSLSNERFKSLCHTDEKLDRIFALTAEGSIWVFTYGFHLGETIADNWKITAGTSKVFKQAKWIPTLSLLACATDSCTVVLLSFSKDFKSVQVVGELQTGNSEVNAINISADDKSIYVVHEDSTVWIYSISEQLFQQAKKERVHYYSDEMLMRKADVGDYGNIVADLKNRIQMLNLEHEKHKEMRDEQYAQKIQDITNKFTMEILGLKDVLNTLEAERNHMRDKKAAEFGSLVEENKAAKDELLGDYGHKFAIEDEKYNQLADLSQKMNEEHSAKVLHIQTSMESEMHNMRLHYEKLLQQKKNQITEMKQSIKLQAAKFDVSIQDIERDADDEILELSTNFERRIRDERHSMDSIIEENKKMKLELDEIGSVLNGFKQELNKHVQEEKRLQGVIKGLQKDMDNVNREVQERNDSIKDKDRRVADLKKKNQELEKFKFVLEYKISELHKQVEPRQNDVVALGKHIEQVNREIVKIGTKHADLVKETKDLKVKLSTKRHEKLYELVRQRELKTVMERVRLELAKVPSVLKQVGPLKQLMTFIYHEFNNAPEYPTFSYNPNMGQVIEKLNEKGIRTEELKIRNQNEHTVRNLLHKFNSEFTQKEQANVRMNHENAILKNELNEIRNIMKNQRDKYQL